MENKNILDVLNAAVVKYAGKVVRLEKNSEMVTFPRNQIGYRKLKEALVKAGEILEENTDSKTIIAVIPTGFQNAARAYAAARIEKDTLTIAAYFKEGLIKQDGAKHAIDQIQKQLR